MASSERMNAPAPTSTRIAGLDTLRALAIVLVMLQHYVLFVSDAPTFGWIGTMGWAGVDLFFALSGYLIGNQIFAALRAPGGFSFRLFYARRLLRTLPAFYAVLALYFLWPAFRAGAELPPLWRFLTFTQNINLNPGTAFSHAWSLCVEEQFYLLLPAAALGIACLRHSLRWAWTSLALAIVAGMLARGVLWDALVDGDPRGRYHFYKFIYYSSLCRFDELLAGVALALLRNHHPAAWQRLAAHGNAALAAGCAVLGLACYWFLHDVQGFGSTVFGFPLLALGFGLLVLAALSPGALLHGARVPGAASLALWSYSIYLLHKQLFILMRAPLAQLGYGPESPQAIVAMMASSVLAGWLLYKLVEAPFMALRARRF
jgi:peptidoglycan/LPS O-acetylase OafA/YrhL